MSRPSDPWKIVSFSLGIVLAFLLFANNWICQDSRTVRSIEYRHDTIYAQVPGDTIVIREAPPTRIIREVDSLYVYADTVVRDTVTELDTIWVAQPATFQLDTLIDADTVFAEFAFPPPRFGIDLRQGPDSVRYITNTITITQPSPWYEKAGWAGLGASATLVAIAVYTIAQ